MSDTFHLETEPSGSDPNLPVQCVQCWTWWCQNQNQCLALCSDCVCLVSQVDVTKCVVNTDPSFRSHWLVAAMCTFGHYLKSVVLHLLREKWCSSQPLCRRMFTLLFLHSTFVDQPTATAPLHQKPHQSCQLGFLFIFYDVCYFELEHQFEKDHQPHGCWALQCAPYSPRAVAAVTDWELFSARTLLWFLSDSRKPSWFTWTASAEK